jgi:ligand-binding sensor domain-containing protein
MPLNKVILISFLTILTSCNGQEKAKTQKDSDTSKPSPAVVKNFQSVGLTPNTDNTLVSQYIRSIFQDSKGNFWFGTVGEGVVRHDEETLTYFSNPDGFINNSVFAINEDKNGNLWFGTDQGVSKYDGKTFKNYRLGQTESILIDKSGSIWVGTQGGVFIYDSTEDSKGGKGFSLFQQLPSANVIDIMEDRGGNIWFATSDNGVFRYDGKTITHITEKEELGRNYAGGIAQDNAGNMWFTMKGGICKYDGKTFTSLTTNDGLGGSEVWGIYIEKSGIIWITARGSTTRYDPSINISNPTAFTVYTEVDGINCCVQSMYQDSSGNMWWGTGQGLYRFDGKRFYQVKQNGPW